MTQFRQRRSEVRTSQHESEKNQLIFSFKTTQLIWLALGLVEALIATRILLKLIGANPESIFAAFIYGFSYLFLFPFEGLVGTPAAGGMVLEISSIIGMIVYALLFWAVERIIWIVFYRPRGEMVGVVQTTYSEPVAVVQTTVAEQNEII